RFLARRSERPMDFRPLAGLPIEELRVWRVPEGTDYGSLAGLTALKELHFNVSTLTDLRPLAGLRLTRLTLNNSPVEDIGPVAAMPLEHLDIGTTGVKSLVPLRGGRVSDLHVHGHVFTAQDVDAVRSLPLTALRANNAVLPGLGFLRGMRLTELQVMSTAVDDLSPLRGMGLTQLWIDDTRVTDLTPLKGMPLEELSYRDVPVKDVRALAGLPLKWVWCTFNRRRDGAVLRGLKTLETINDTPVAEFWKEHGP
ncbi:MAG: hypothetical protein ACRC33_16970, partial [Gemmataceae bacterium]